MKDKFKSFFRWILTFCVCFILIYLVVFFGGWQLFESGDVVLIELGIALILSIFVFAFYEITNKLEKTIKSLEDRISKLENTTN